jgi:glycosyltransferase involved in cell wall biosynthesis
MSASPLLVSALVPIFNHAAYVEGCLESLARQDHPRLELVAIDDGSSDASHEVAARWLESNGHRFERWSLQRQDNAGITRTFNRLVARSRGELLFPLASDDEAMDGAIAALVARHEPDDARILFSDVSIIDTAGALLAPGTHEWRGRDIARLARSDGYLRWQLLAAWGTPFQHQMIPRAILEAFGGYDESLPFEDVALALRASARGLVRFVPVATRRYRVRPGSSPTPGIANEDWRLAPSRAAVRAEFSAPMRLAIDLLDLRERLPKSSLRRRMAAALLRAMGVVAGMQR